MGAVENVGAVNRSREISVRQRDEVASRESRSQPKEFERSLPARVTPAQEGRPDGGQQQRSSQNELSDAARQRTIEELRTIIKAVQVGETDPQ